jgi:hypothetical protein
VEADASPRWRGRVVGQEAVSVDDGGGNVEQLTVGAAGLVAQHLEGGCVVDGVALDDDAPWRARGWRCAGTRFEVVVLGEAAQHDVDRALPVLGPTTPTRRRLAYITDADKAECAEHQRNTGAH